MTLGDLPLVVSILMPLLAGAASWGGSLVAIRGVKETQAEVKKDLDGHIAADSHVQMDLVERLSRIEGMLSRIVRK